QNASMSPQRREAPAHTPATANGSGTPGRASFGRMELGDAAPAGATAEAPEAPRPAAPDDEGGDRALYYKVGIAVGGLAALIIVVTLIVMSLGGDKPALNPE